MHDDFVNVPAFILADPLISRPNADPDKDGVKNTLSLLSP